MDLIVKACEKYQWQAEEIAFFLKVELDEKFGCSWHVVVGEEFGSSMDYEVLRLDRDCLLCYNISF